MLSSALPLPVLIRDVEDQVPRLHLTHRRCLQAVPQRSVRLNLIWAVEVVSVGIPLHVHHVRRGIAVEPEDDEANPGRAEGLGVERQDSQLDVRPLGCLGQGE